MLTYPTFQHDSAFIGADEPTTEPPPPYPLLQHSQWRDWPGCLRDTRPGRPLDGLTVAQALVHVDLLRTPGAATQQEQLQHLLHCLTTTPLIVGTVDRGHWPLWDAAGAVLEALVGNSQPHLRHDLDAAGRHHLGLLCQRWSRVTPPPPGASTRGVAIELPLPLPGSHFMRYCWAIGQLAQTAIPQTARPFGVVLAETRSCGPDHLPLLSLSLAADGLLTLHSGWLSDSTAASSCWTEARTAARTIFAVDCGIGATLALLCDTPQGGDEQLTPTAALRQWRDQRMLRWNDRPVPPSDRSVELAQLLPYAELARGTDIPPPFLRHSNMQQDLQRARLGAAKLHPYRWTLSQEERDNHHDVVRGCLVHFLLELLAHLRDLPALHPELPPPMPMRFGLPLSQIAAVLAPAHRTALAEALRNEDVIHHIARAALPVATCLLTRHRHGSVGGPIATLSQALSAPVLAALSGNDAGVRHAPVRNSLRLRVPVAIDRRTAAPLACLQWQGAV